MDGPDRSKEVCGTIREKNSRLDYKRDPHVAVPDQQSCGRENPEEVRKTPALSSGTKDSEVGGISWWMMDCDTMEGEIHTSVEKGVCAANSSRGITTGMQESSRI